MMPDKSKFENFASKLATSISKEDRISVEVFLYKDKGINYVEIMHVLDQPKGYRIKLVSRRFPLVINPFN